MKIKNVFVELADLGSISADCTICSVRTDEDGQSHLGLQFGMLNSNDIKLLSEYVLACQRHHLKEKVI